MPLPPPGDDLDRPLGTDLGHRGRGDGGPSAARMALLGAVAIAVSLAAFAYLTGDETGGQPLAVARIETPAPVAKPPEVGKTDATPTGTTAAATIPFAAKTSRAGGTVEEENGVTIVRLGGGGASAAKIIRIPRREDADLTPAPDRRVSERFEQGVLPRIGADGVRPAALYSRVAAVPEGMPASAPRVAIVIGGMGLNKSATADALLHLPGPVTMAFAPYGPDLVRQAAHARAQGHEIMLQAPMQPFGYPVVDPGPRTLTVSAAPSENLARLHWFMSRFPGYVGIMNYLGGEFTADAAAFRPVLQELADRGLIYADDGTSSRSLARPLAAGLDLPIVAADIALDADTRPEAVDAALLRLETLARLKGLAVGSANGLPSTLERVERWTRAAQARGILLIPLSAAVTAQRRASVNREP